METATIRYGRFTYCSFEGEGAEMRAIVVAKMLSRDDHTTTFQVFYGSDHAANYKAGVHSVPEA